MCGLCHWLLCSLAQVQGHTVPQFHHLQKKILEQRELRVVSDGISWIQKEESPLSLGSYGPFKSPSSCSRFCHVGVLCAFLFCCFPFCLYLITQLSLSSLASRLTKHRCLISGCLSRAVLC